MANDSPTTAAEKQPAFVEGPYRVRDKSGALVEAGYQWTEPRLGMFALFVSAGVILFFVGAAFGAFALQGKGPSGSTWLVYLLLWAVLIVAGGILGKSRRVLIFKADGSIHSPFGLVMRPLSTAWTRTHTDITSCEQYQMWTYIYFRNGEHIGVARFLDTDRPKKIAIQLSAALQELRTSLSNPNMPPKGARRIID
jgi:hypothetical protein